MTGLVPSHGRGWQTSRRPADFGGWTNEGAHGCSLFPGFGFLGLAPFQPIRDADNAVHTGNYDDIGPMKAKTRERVEKFFAPYNEQLGNLLGEEWRDVWQRKIELRFHLKVTAHELGLNSRLSATTITLARPFPTI